MDFERFRHDYRDRVNEALAFSGTEQEFYLRTKAEWLSRVAEERLDGTAALSVLDVGCGVGLIDGMLPARFGRPVGVDVALGVLAQAKRNVPAARFVGYDGALLPFREGTFDLVFAVCVLHHVPPDDWSRFVSELARVTRPGGLVVIFEHNPRNPVTRIVVNRCEFDRHAILVGAGRVRRLMGAAGLRECEPRHILFFPWAGALWGALERVLGWLPLGAQYYVAGRKAG